MPRERDRLTWLPLQAGLVAALIAGLVASAISLVALRMEAPLERERAAGQRAVLDLLADEIGRALDLGIPLASLPDLQRHLDVTIGQFPDLSAAVVAMPDGFEAVAGVVGPADVPLAEAIGPGRLTLYRAPDSKLVRALTLTVAAATTGAGLGAAAFAWFLVRRPARRAEAVLARRLADTAAGDFARPPATAPGLPADAAATELATWRADVNQRRRLLDQQAAGVRAIDFDGSLGPRVDAVLARVDAGRRFADPAV